MKVQISQRGNEYLETARTLLRAAETMTDRAIAGQLGALADDSERQAGKASHVDAAKHRLARLLALNPSGHDVPSGAGAARPAHYENRNSLERVRCVLS
jgi:hypothetical protein